jgi:hypothetical protein
MHIDPWDALERAIALAVEAHHGQRDKANRPYLLHLLQVMASVPGPIEKQAAVLHDYLEDTPGTVGILECNQLSHDAIEAIVLLTKPDDSTYCDYVVRLSHNPTATAVKLADLEDNYRIGRVAYRSGHESEDALRMQRYAVSYQFLRHEITEQEYRSRMELL